MKKLDKLREELLAQIESFKVESNKHKHMYRSFRYAVFLLAAASAILGSIALTFPASQQGANLAIVAITSLVGVLTSVEGLRKPAELWIHERTTYYALKDLLRELEYRAAQSISENEVDQIFHRMQSILGASNEKWSRRVQPTPGAPSADGLPSGSGK